jgi:hypothetical protein
MKDIRTYIILALFVWIVLFYTCNKPKTEYKTIETVRVDSIRVTDTLVKTIHVPITEVKYIKEEPLGIDLSDTNEFSSGLRRFYYRQKDSLLDASIYVDSDKRPQKVSLEYDLKQFTVRDSVFVKDSVYQKGQLKSFVSCGLTVLGNESYFGVAPSVFYHHKSGSNYGLHYDLINKNIGLTFVKRISFRKNR